MKFVESLIRNKFSMHLTDSNGETPMGYLLTDSVPESALLPVIKVAVKYGFNLLSPSSGQSAHISSGSSEPDLTNSFIMELCKAGKMTLKIFKLVEPLFKQ